MLNPRIASRYAKSLIDLAKEQDQLEAVYKDMLLLQTIIKGNPDFVALLRSPIITADKKVQIFEAITSGKISGLTAAFNKLLIKKGREATLPEVITSFVEQFKKLKEIYTVKLTTATPLSETLKDQIIAQVRATSNMQHIDLETVIKPEIIGGFVLQAGDKLVDVSIAYDLRQISKQFENNDFIYKVR